MLLLFCSFFHRLSNLHANNHNLSAACLRLHCFFSSEVAKIQPQSPHIFYAGQYANKRVAKPNKKTKRSDYHQRRLMSSSLDKGRKECKTHPPPSVKANLPEQRPRPRRTVAVVIFWSRISSPYTTRLCTCPKIRGRIEGGDGKRGLLKLVNGARLSGVKFPSSGNNAAVFVPSRARKPFEIIKFLIKTLSLFGTLSIFPYPLLLRNEGGEGESNLPLPFWFGSKRTARLRGR